MCHVSEFIVANRLSLPLAPQNQAEAEPTQWYGLAEEEHSVLGCEARGFTSDHTRMTPKEAQDGGLRWWTPRGPASELCCSSRIVYSYSNVYNSVNFWYV